MSEKPVEQNQPQHQSPPPSYESNIAQVHPQPGALPAGQPYPVNYQPGYQVPPQPPYMVNMVAVPLDPRFACPVGGSHQYAEAFTTCGIIWAVCCFPWGLICLFSDRITECVKCKRPLNYNTN
jgi:hypothetical protein